MKNAFFPAWHMETNLINGKQWAVPYTIVRVLYTSHQSLLINVIVYHIAEGGVSLQEADRML